MSQDRKFVAVVVENLPEVQEDVKQGWIENPSALQKALREALCPPVVQGPARRWSEENGLIYFEVTSDGTTGPQWIERLEKEGFRLSKWAKDVLNSPEFKPTSGTTYRIAILKGTLFTDRDRITKKIRAEAERRKLAKPNAEVACLIREMFSDEELETMGLWWIVVFHEPIRDSDG
ncbi:hypothetical protein KKC00_00280, partial [Patescibacteria group bacterium]|nr:hypothetical protein [Patescibacteria group bacterium]